ncbi:nucleolar complex protein 4 homolog isoform X2 [Takifugu rubripes]|uniref:Nucleolar complex associated 4 homolog n=1 Tax=Takifugu rubripes TaxID=31033 RepID=A0A674MHC2_TAKRU|nr:nucleolar complex protein 4 homolog isoform X2 [Takifugu rubripes]XP_056879343.1 nucleolar complex protein 4 homolog [Takifugu flavidus]
MAPVSRKRHVSSAVAEQQTDKRVKIEPNHKVEEILQSKKHANAVYDIFELLQSEKVADVVGAAGACSRLFCCLLQRREMFQGKVPPEEEAMSGHYSPQEKYSIFMRHRYSSCVEMLLELLDHELHQIAESGLCCLMQFAAAEGNHPLLDLDWSEHHSFPRELILAVVNKLLSKTVDSSLLISRFQEFLEMDDVRYYVMSSVRENLTKVMDRSRGEVLPVYQSNVFTLMSNISIPNQESELTSFMVKQGANHADWKAAKLKEHKRVFEKMWLGFLKYQLPSNMYKKVLVILHDSVLPHMSEPSLMIDFLTAAYEMGGGISLLALNGLFILIHEHNLDYPDFYKKLYSLLEPSVFHVKYRARFFHLANLFLSSSHLPAYLVAAFAKRLARLALTAPPTGLLIALPFIYNLIRRHPSVRVLLHRPSEEEATVVDPYVMEEEDPAQCGALESSLWEIKTLQKHHHPDVSKAAGLINTPLVQQEEDISKVLETTTYQLMEQELKQTVVKKIPLEFETAAHFLQGGGGALGRHFCLTFTSV